MTKRLLSAVRNLAQDCETIAAACRKIERQLTVAVALDEPIDEGKVQQMVERIERRATTAFDNIGIRGSGKRKA